MKIEEALKETGKAVRTVHADNYAAIKSFSLSKVKPLGGDRLYWYDIKTGEENSPAQLSAILAGDWQSYHEEKAIRPEKAGELWRNKEIENDQYYHTENHTSSGAGLILVGYGAKGFKEADNGRVLHNKDGWERVFPKVEDDSVERIEIEGVKWVFSKKAGYQIPQWPISGPDSLYPLLDKPPMKMILEIPKT